MPQLREIQQAFAEAMINGNHQAVTGVTFPKASALRSVVLYRRLIRTNYTQMLMVTYPALRRLVGQQYFDMLARGYFRRYPSTSGDLFPYGRHLPEFLKELQVSPLLAELVRLEWACHEVYQASDSPPLSHDQLDAITSADPSRVTFRLHAAARLLRFSLPVHRVWQALQPEAPTDEVVDLALPEEESNVVVTRSDGKVRVTPLARLDYLLLETMSKGVDLASAGRMVVASEPEFDFQKFWASVLNLHLIARFSIEEHL